VQIGTSYIKAFESYRLTDRHTYRQTDRQDKTRQTRPKLHTTPLRGWSKNNKDFFITCLLSTNLIFTKNDDVADDNVNGVAQARVAIQFGNLTSNREAAHCIACLNKLLTKRRRLSCVIHFTNSIIFISFVHYLPVNGLWLTSHELNEQVMYKAFLRLPHKYPDIT